MDVTIVEKLAYLPDGHGQRMPNRNGEHRISNGTQNLIHTLRLVSAGSHPWVGVPGSAQRL